MSVLMRNSERATFRRCRLKWDWSYNRRLGPQREKGALTFGSMVHEALAEYYPPGFKRGPLPAVTFERLYAAQPRKFDQWDDEGNKVPALELGIEMLRGYLREWGPDDHIEIIAPEIALRVDVFDENGVYLCTWVGRGDAAYKDHSSVSRRSKPRIGMLEHKTAKSIEKNLRINSGYGEQGLSYWWGCSYVLREQGLLPAGEQIDHVQFNWLRKGLPSTKARNADGHTLNNPSKDALIVRCSALGIDAGKKPTIADLTTVLELAGVDVALLGEPAKVQPSPLFERHNLDFGGSEHAMINERIRLEAKEMAMVRAGQLPIYKNPTKDCSWDCPFVEACELHEMGQDYQSVLDLEMVKWSPYDQHELLEEKS